MYGLKIRFAVYFCFLTVLSFFVYKSYQTKYTLSLSAVLQYLPDEQKIEALQNIKTGNIKIEILEKLVPAFWKVFFTGGGKKKK